MRVNPSYVTLVLVTLLIGPLNNIAGGPISLVVWREAVKVLRMCLTFLGSILGLGATS